MLIVNAFASNSQKKLVRTTSGWLHKVYESMGKVWYELSTNNGSTWTVGNYGRPLSSGNAKLPAIDYSGNDVIIVWQEEYDGSFKIRVASNDRPSATQLKFYDVYDASFWVDPTPYSYNTMPVIAWVGPKLIVVWQEYGLYYRYGTADSYGPTSFYTSELGTFITGTDNNSINSSIVAKKDPYNPVFHLGWQQSTSYIKYCTLTPNAQNNINVSAFETPSSGSGFSYHISPSISIKSDGYPTLVWVGSLYPTATTQVTKRSRISSGWLANFYKYGANVNSPTEYNGHIVWSETNNINKYYRPNSTIRTLTTIGKSVQISTGSSLHAVAYRQLSPYDFQTSPDLITIPKSNSIVNQCGRGGIITKGESEFYFILADVTGNGEIIQFKDINDTTLITNINELNNYLSSNSFSVNEGESLTFSIAYGVNDSLKALTELNDGSEIHFTIELVDANTNEILGELGNFVFDENNLSVYNEQTYSVNTQGIGNRSVKLRVTSNTNFEGTYYLATIFNDDNILGKSNSKELILTGGSVVNSYDLFQNYPNPFNPSTIINYQIPEDGIVTLKIYDVLGNEIKTLVNEQKTTGKYEVSFDAANLASGIYIYKIQVNNFVSSKKTMLIR